MSVTKDPWTPRFIALFLFLLGLRILFLLVAPLDLSPDEAYYWDWSRRPDWGYYSKPPMVAWIIWASTTLLGDTAFSVRLPAALLATGSLIPVYLLARRLFGDWAAFFSALGAAVMPGTAVLGLAMTIDPPLVFAWSVAMYSFWRAADGRDRPIWWIATGLACGLGLLSKQTMAAFPFLALIFLILTPGQRSALKGPWPYAAAALAASFLIPVCLWNMGHGWITLEHTAHHFDPHKQTLLSVTSILSFLGSQAGVVSPILFFLILAAGSALLVRIRSLAPETRYLVVLSCLPLLGITVLALRQDINANWPAPFYLAAPILLAGLFSRNGQDLMPLLYPLRRLYIPGILLGATLTALLFTSPWAVSIFGIEGGKWDPTVRLRGWKTLGERIGAVIDTFPEGEKPFLLGVRRQVTSELAFYSPGRPRTYRWTPSPHKVKTQYELWPNPLEDGLAGKDALIVLDKRDRLPQGLAASFEKVEDLGRIRIPLGRHGERNYRIYLGRVLRSW